MFRILLREVLLQKRLLVYRVFRSVNTETDSKLVLFESFKGKSYSCSPKAIYEYMINTPEFKEYRFVWAFKNTRKHKFILENPRTEIVKMYGKNYEKALIKSKYWVTNYRMLDHIIPRKDQVYVQCWHGTPLKRLGFDLDYSENAMNSTREIRSKYTKDALRFKYLLSPSEFCTDKFTSAWNLKNYGKENVIIEEGYPRNDILFNYNKEIMKDIKEKLGIPSNDHRKIILYAPTWRDNQHESGVGYTYKVKLDLYRMKEKLVEEYLVLFRLHYLVANSIDFDEFKDFIYNVSLYDDINHLYLASDMLITDYSSVMFDYANLERPMLFYMYDLENYRDDIRGFYFDISELPGEIITEEDRLIKAIKETSESFKFDNKYKKFNNKYNYLDDGNASQRVANRIFNKE